MTRTDTPGDQKPVTVALAGYGMAGRDIHRPLLTSTGYEITHVVTTNADRMQQVNADLPNATVVPSLELALQESPELVVLATGTGAHHDGVMMAIEAAIPVVVDKPLDTDGPGAQALLAHAERLGAKLTVFQNRRWDDEQRTLRSLIADGTLGEILRFERRWERWRPVPKSRWKENATAEHGGGLLLDLGAHLVDSAIELFGPVESVYAELRAISTPAEDDVFIVLRHRDGVISHLQAGGLVAAPGPRTRVLGTKAGYINTEFEGEPSSFTANSNMAREPVQPGDSQSPGWVVAGDQVAAAPFVTGGHEDFYNLVARWVRGNGPAPVDPKDAVRTAWILDAARISAKNHQVVPVNSGGQTLGR